MNKNKKNDLGYIGDCCLKISDVYQLLQENKLFLGYRARESIQKVFLKIQFVHDDMVEDVGRFFRQNDDGTMGEEIPWDEITEWTLPGGAHYGEGYIHGYEITNPDGCRRDYEAVILEFEARKKWFDILIFF